MNLPQYPQVFLQFVSMCWTYSWSQYPNSFHSLQTDSSSKLVHSKRDYENYSTLRTKYLDLSTFLSLNNELDNYTYLEGLLPQQLLLLKLFFIIRILVLTIKIILIIIFT